MDKFLYYNELFLVYKDLIKESNREIFDLYYEDKLKVVLKNIKLEHVLELNDINEIKKEINDIINIDEYLKVIDESVKKDQQSKGE